MISEKVQRLALSVEAGLKDMFDGIDAVARENTARVMKAFQRHRVSDACFAGTTGYGYDDKGRETLDKIYADVFGAQAALVRSGIVNGTQAISAALFAALAPGDVLLSATGLPYDTLRGCIGIGGNGYGSLAYYGIGYAQAELLPDGGADLESIAALASDQKVRAVLIQRSRGYAQRKALSIEEIGAIVAAVRAVNPAAAVIVDSCYGEFVETREPCHVGADLMAGSLIKNPGGGLAPTGGYIAGREDLVLRAAERVTCPGIGGECGSTLGVNRLLFQGFFIAPHTVAQALKTAVFCAGMLEELGFKTSPAATQPRHDIIQMVTLGSEENMRRFCRGIQMGAPVDSYVTPEPWQMPGYDCPVIMAAGAFIQGASIELSADGPVREPYAVYLQGGLTYESGRLGIMEAVSEMMN